MNRIDELINKYNKLKLKAMKERREYKTDHGHNWVISCYKEFIKDLKLRNGAEKCKTCDNVLYCLVCEKDLVQEFLVDSYEEGCNLELEKAP